MNDVAKRAGVSQMTVSRVMNKNGYISSDVRRKVELAADEIGYVKNRLAHSLRSDSSHIVAVVMPSIGNTVFTDILSGITDAITELGYQSFFGVTEYSQDRENELVQDLLTWQPSGIVLAGLEHSEKTRNAVRSSGVRVAEIMDIDGTPISAAFGLSHKKAGQITADYMIERGHRTFAYVGSLGGRDLRAIKRLEGFIDALNASNASLISRDISPLSSSMVEGLRMTAEVMARPNKPDAIYYANDDLAAGGIMYCIANQISIPNDLALAGFNGLPFLNAFPIQLTTIKTPRYQIGKQAGHFLVDPHPDSSPPVVDLGFELIRGDTC
jgi:LacI family gluconate utilization system Gnt-I transcriptional repressor